MKISVVVACMLVGLCMFPVGPHVGHASLEAGKNVEQQVRPEWEKRYVKEARITIEKGVMSVMSGLTSPEHLRDSVEYFCRTWDNWADSQLFILQNERDIDVYGNLYSLQVICRTLRLAAEDWYAVEKSSLTETVLEKALMLEKRSRLLADPVAEIIVRQSYSEYLPRRVEIMKEQFPYVDEFYRKHSFHAVVH